MDVGAVWQIHALCPIERGVGHSLCLVQESRSIATEGAAVDQAHEAAVRAGAHDERPHHMTVLLVEDSASDAMTVHRFLSEARDVQFDVQLVDRLKPAMERLAEGGIDVVLTDLMLPDSSGVDTFLALRGRAMDTPIVVLTGVCDDDAEAVSLVQRGASDYLVKGQFSAAMLARVLRYAVERKRAEAQLRQAHQRLIQAAKFESIGRLAAGVAHEVKNPLAMLMIGIEMLADRVDAADRQTAALLQDMMQAVKRADAVIKGLLDFSAPERLEMAVADLNVVIEQSLRLVKHELDRQHVVVVRRLGEALPPMSLDRMKMEQVFVNLFMNAIQAMPGGGALMIRTSVTPFASDSGCQGRRRTDVFRLGELVAVVEVEDTGQGIPPERLSKVFDPFVTMKPAGQGTGLGLAVTKKIVELHGGTIDIANRAEGGVRVTMRLAAGGGVPRGQEADSADRRRADLHAHVEVISGQDRPL